ncbi:MAG TPA: hypothetical protein VLI21_10355 [Casimicrobiaceae bacterium]|nr:hypothetical protein [Casimicrobiaceae bacterium]
MFGLTQVRIIHIASSLAALERARCQCAISCLVFGVNDRCNPLRVTRLPLCTEHAKRYSKYPYVH